MLATFTRRYWLAAVTVLLTTGAIPARADLIIGNLPGNNSNVSVIGALGSTAAMGFTMGSSSYTLTDAELVLTLTAPTASPPSLSNAPLLQLRSDVSGAPGASLLTFTNPDFTKVTPLTPSTFTFTPSTPFTLQANTSYFLYLASSTTLGAPFLWDASKPAVTPTGSGATYLKSTTSALNSFELDGQDPPANPNVASTPEPSTLFIVAATVPVGLGFWWFKRRRVAA